MVPAAYHHLAIRVSELTRSTSFYMAVFGGRKAFQMQLDSEFLENMLRSEPGVSGRLNWLTFEHGTSLELWEFIPQGEISTVRQTSLGLMHFGLWVDDVSATVSRAEVAGGRSRIPIRPWRQGHKMTFIEDPDGHVIELLDATQDETIRIIQSGEGPPDHTSAVRPG
jgi:catechol 2,3-dioxygenase-like lactoylglutathione lyase family enzyme